MTTNNTTHTPTDRQIRALRAEAAGDLVLVHICAVALGEQEPITTGEEWEERYGGGGFSGHERRAIMAIASQEQAVAECAAAIAAAHAE